MGVCLIEYEVDLVILINCTPNVGKIIQNCPINASMLNSTILA